MPGPPSAAVPPPYASVPWGSCSVLEHAASRAGQPPAGPAGAAPAAKLPQASGNLCGYSNCFLDCAACSPASYMLEQPPSASASKGRSHMTLHRVESKLLPPSSYPYLDFLGTKALVLQAMQRKRLGQRQAWRGAQACRWAGDQALMGPPHTLLPHPAPQTPHQNPGLTRGSS